MALGALKCGSVSLVSPERAAGVLWGFVSDISEELHFRFPMAMTEHSTNVE